MASSYSLASPRPTPSLPYWMYDVFPIFHGPDVRKGFLSHLMKELMSKGIYTSNDYEIERTKSIRPNLMIAIRKSRVAIVILSRNFASSSWCLEQLVEILKCREDLGQVVVPVFYELDPVDVEMQTGDFGEVFWRTCKGKTIEDTERWRQALATVATIAGENSLNWNKEATLIEKIVTDISYKLNNFTPARDSKSLDFDRVFEDEVDDSKGLDFDEDEVDDSKGLDFDEDEVDDSVSSIDFEGLVGMNAHMEDMKALLSLDSDEARLVGIWGPAGIGKTTIARFVFNQLSHHFQLSVFMEDIKRCYQKPSGYDTEKEFIGIDEYEYSVKLELQRDFLSQIFNQTDIMIPHLEALANKKVLVVLDDVGSLEQLEALANEIRWFGPGSRIIITTQDDELLNGHAINHIYKVGFPPPDEALQIFYTYAFGQKAPFDGFEALALEVTELAGGLPLGLRVMGSYLYGKSKQEWTNALPRLRTSLDGKIESIRKFMIESFCDDDKELSHHRISYLRDDEFSESMEEHLGKDFLELRQELITTNQDLKEDLSTSERSFEDTVYIYCEGGLQYSFASHLSMNLRRKRIDAFVNCEESLNIIESLSATVVIFSKSCFSSTSYFEKLVRVLQCWRKTGQLVIPVFYGISPSDVVVQEQESANWIREWSNALQELRELPGHQSREKCSERKFVEEIVEDVYEKLFPAQQIGINSKLLEIEQLLCKQPWGIRRIGIWGMPGIGKTTLAKAVFDQISGSYEASCFIKHFDKAFQERGLHRLLEENFGSFFKKLPRVCSTITRPSLFEDKLSKKRALVILDDVHNPLVAESFLRGFHWFGPGSLIIITSRDKQVFRLCQINHVYEVQRLNENEALQLFSQCVGKDIYEQDLLELSMGVIDYANGNPLALSFYSKGLKGKNVSEMKDLFIKRTLGTPYQIHGLFSLFKSSYETLNDSEKNIFLDIVCFFVGEDVDYVLQLLEGCGFFPHVGIDVLVEKCLVTISENRVKMHRIIQDFGREIVLIERPRRLWERRIIKSLLEDGRLKANGDGNATYTQCTEDIEAIYLDTSDLIFDVKPTAMENMLNLRLLKIYCSNYEKRSGLCLPKGLESLPCELRLLHWENYPLQSLPQDFDPSHLVELDMSCSQLQKLWRGTKNLGMLKRVRLCHSKKLNEIDDICKAEKIEIIDLQDCTALQSFPATNQLQHLRVVNLSGCKEIKTFPEVSPNIQELLLQSTRIRELPISIGNAINLQKLDLSNCSSLVKLPSSFGNAINLKELRLTGCSSLVELPSSFGNAINLKRLFLNGCSSLMELPASFVNIINLEILELSDCSSLMKLPSLFGNAINLKELYLTGCYSLVKLPSLFGNAINLKILYLNGCSSLVKLPASFGNTINLEILDLSNCSRLVKLPSSFGNAINLRELYLIGCSSLVELPASFGNTINLEILDLSNCSRLVKLPSSFGNAINLKNLYIIGCSSLVELSSLFWNATNLKKLYLIGCSSLVELPTLIGNATNLEILDLSKCSSLVKIPSSIGNAINLKELYLGECSSLLELPTSLENAINLEILDLCNCKSLVKLPSSLGNATNLKELYLIGCSSLVDLPSFWNAINLKKLYLTGCSCLVELPAFIGNATSLEILDLNNCSSLVKIPSSIGNAINLKILDLSSCSSLVELPSSIGNATNLQNLNLEYCSKLVELPSSLGNIINLTGLYVTGCSSLVEVPSSIKNSNSLMSIDLNEDNNLPIVTSIDTSGSKCIEVRRAKSGNFYVLKGEQNDKHYVSLVLRMVDENERVRNIHFMFYRESDTASKVSSVMVEQLELKDQDVTFIAEMIDILLVNMIPTWKTNVTVDHLIHSRLNQNSRSYQNKSKDPEAREDCF